MANNIAATGAINAAGFESEAPHNFAFATWRAVPFTTDGPAVFLDGSIVPTYQGQLDATGNFAAGALIGDTSQMRPPSTRFMFVVYPVASAPAITISNVAFTSSSAQTLGALLSAQIAPLRIQAAALVYAYSQQQIVNPTAGSGYINTTDNSSWLFVGAGSVGQWIKLAGGGGTTPTGPQNTVAVYNGPGSGAAFALGAAPKLLTNGAGDSLYAQGKVKSYGPDGGPDDVTRTNVTLGTNLSGATPFVKWIRAAPPPDMRVWSMFASSSNTQFVMSADQDGGSNFAWLIVNRPAPGQPSFVEMFQKLQVDAPVKAQNFLAGTDDTTYLLRLTSAAHNQAAIETTSAAEFALLRFLTPSANWTVGVAGATAPGGPPNAFYLYDATNNFQPFRIDAATGIATFTAPPSNPDCGLHINPQGGGTDGRSVQLLSIDGPPIDLTNFGNGVIFRASSLANGTMQVNAGNDVVLIWSDSNGLGLGSLGRNAGTSSFDVRATGGDLNLQANANVNLKANTNVVVSAGSGFVKSYSQPTIANRTGSRAFNTAYQNTTGMSIQVSMTYTTSGSATGFVTANVGPDDPPAEQVYRNENTASVSGAELAIVFTVPPNWWYSVSPGSGEITGIGRWWEWTCP